MFKYLLMLLISTTACGEILPNDVSEITNCSMATSVGSSALTISLKTRTGADPSTGNPCIISFKSATATTGTYSRVRVTAATSVVISSGSSLGHNSASAEYINVYVIDNAGTVVLGACTDCAVSDGKLVSTTAEGGAGAADDRYIMYSTAAQTAKQARFLGIIFVTESTAGTWASAPTGINYAKLTSISPKAIAVYKVSGNPVSDQSTPIDFATKVFDNMGAVTTGAAWKFTAPTWGVYTILLHPIAVATGTTSAIYTYKNGSISEYVVFITASQEYTGSMTQVLNAGDYIDLRCYTSANVSSLARVTIYQN